MPILSSTRRQVGTTPSRVLAALCIAIGSLVLAGWLFDITMFTRIFPAWASMKSETAISLILCGISLAFFEVEPRRFGASVLRRGLSRGFAAAAVLLNAVVLTEYLFGWSLGIDQLAFIDPQAGTSFVPPGRTPPAAVFSYVLLGCALFLLSAHRKRAQAIAQALALGTGALSFFCLLGYLYGPQSLYRIAPFTSLALHTSLGLALLSAGVLLARRDEALMATVSGKSPGSLMLRRLMLYTLTVPAVLGWLRMRGELAGLYDTRFGLTLLVMSNIVLLTLTIWVNARSLQRMDQKRRAAEEEQRAAEKRYRSTLDHMMEGCQIIGFDWRYLYVNGVAARQGHAKSEELVGRTMEEVYPGIQSTELFSQLRRCMEARVPLRMENEFHYPDGQKGLFTLSIEPVPEGIFILSSDITEERKLAEELSRHRGRLEELVKERTAQLAAANGELEAFSYSVSHDLRAPLRHVGGFADLLSRRAEASLDEEGRRFLAKIKEAAVQMGSLIDDLLVFSRMGRAELRAVTVDLERMARDTIQNLTQQDGQRTVQWEIGQLPTVQGDPAMLRLVLQNLIENALKYTRPRERAVINIAGTTTPAEAVVTVRDNGVGFDMRYADKLFGVFQRLHRAEEFEGTGIGLANVRRIVQRHGGRTWAEGEVGKGAAVSFSLPVQPAVPQPPGAAQPPVLTPP
ncbi:MAG: sensor histidine kinase [Spirochaetia bacterium]